MPDKEVILITGALGLVGSRLVSLLTEHHHPNREIILSVRCRSSVPIELKKDYSIADGDIRQAEIWRKLPENITHVFHLAAVIPWEHGLRNKASVILDNIAPTAHLIEYSQRWKKLRQIIFSSSISVYAQSKDWIRENSPTTPSDIYGASKLAGEIMLRCLESRGVVLTLLRYSSIYGYGQYPGTVLPMMINRAMRGRPLQVFGNGMRTQDFLHCEDAAAANLLAKKKEKSGEFNIGSGVPVTMLNLALTVNRFFSKHQSIIEHIPEVSSRNTAPGIKLDISKAIREISYEPKIQLENGLRKLKHEMEIHDIGIP